MAVLVPVSGLSVRAADDVFTIANVDVDATAKTAAAARDEALLQGQRKALDRLFDRLVLASERDRLPEVSTSTVTDLVLGFEVADEKTSAVRYLATLKVRFKPSAVRALLRQSGIGFAETRSKPVLVLPVYDVSGALALWDEPNPWRAAWDRLPMAGGLTPMIVPHGDLRDISLIGAEQAVQGNAQQLSDIARRYGASEVIVARAGLRGDATGAPEGDVRLQVVVSRFGSAGMELTFSDTYAPREGETAEDLLVRAAASVVDSVEETWKRNNRLRFGEGDEIVVHVPVGNLTEWLEVRRRLSGIASVRGSDLIYLSRNEAHIRLSYIGDRDQLRVALLQSDLKLEAGTTAWEIILSGGSADLNRPDPARNNPDLDGGTGTPAP